MKGSVMIDPLKLAVVAESFHMLGAIPSPPQDTDKVYILTPAVIEAFEVLSEKYGTYGASDILLRFLDSCPAVFEVEDREILVEALKAVKEFPDIPFTTVLAGIKGKRIGLEAVWR